LRDNYALLTASSLDNFLFEDSELSFYFAGKEGTKSVAVDDDWGYLFDRSVLQGGSYWYGLWSYVYDTGEVVIGWGYDDYYDKESSIICKDALYQPFSTDPRYVQFIVKDGSVTLYVDGVKRCSSAMNTTVLDNEQPLIFGGSMEYAGKYYNLNADLIDIKLTLGEQESKRIQSISEFEYEVVWS